MAHCMEDMAGRELGRESSLCRVQNTLGISLCSVGDNGNIFVGMGHDEIDDIVDHLEGDMEEELRGSWQPEPH